jgi:hypothetical protein
MCEIHPDCGAQAYVFRGQAIGSSKASHEHVLNRPLAKTFAGPKLFTNFSVGLAFKIVKSQSAFGNALRKALGVTSSLTRETARPELVERGVCNPLGGREHPQIVDWLAKTLEEPSPDAIGCGN